jgi:hypothetical protein
MGRAADGDAGGRHQAPGGLPRPCGRDGPGPGRTRAPGRTPRAGTGRPPLGRQRSGPAPCPRRPGIWRSAVTGGTAGAARPGPFDVDQDRALDALRLAWSDVYDTGFADGAYRAARIDGTGDLLIG